MDTRGQLYLEDTYPRNIATSLKDKKFLSFFYKNLRLNKTGKFEKEYKYVSMCGSECNYLLPIDPCSSLVYTDLDIHSKSIKCCDQTMVQFNPSLLLFHEGIGRLYYPIIHHKYLSNSTKDNIIKSPCEEYGVLHPHLCQHICKHVMYNEEMHEWILNWNSEENIILSRMN